MMARHMAPIPAEYAGLTNPGPVDEASLARGAETYTTFCATCHGDGGMGDGPAGATLEPPAAPIAHTSQMMGDDYLFWRISEGGAMAPFNSVMIPYKNVLDEQARWDVINYIQALGSGRVTPKEMMGGSTTYDPALEKARRAEILAQAVTQGVITQEEANTFEETHALMETYMVEHMADRRAGGMGAMQAAALKELVASGQITQEQADTFMAIRDKLLTAELLP
jgi:mono/diheme cytochrome c family protein